MDSFYETIVAEIIIKNAAVRQRLLLQNERNASLTPVRDIDLGPQ